MNRALWQYKSNQTAQLILVSRLATLDEIITACVLSELLIQANINCAIHLGNHSFSTTIEAFLADLQFYQPTKVTGRQYLHLKFNPPLASPKVKQLYWEQTKETLDLTFEALEISETATRKVTSTPAGQEFFSRIWFIGMNEISETEDWEKIVGSVDLENTAITKLNAQYAVRDSEFISGAQALRAVAAERQWQLSEKQGALLNLAEANARRYYLTQNVALPIENPDAQTLKKLIKTSEYQTLQSFWEGNIDQSPEKNSNLHDMLFLILLFPELCRFSHIMSSKPGFTNEIVNERNEEIVLAATPSLDLQFTKYKNYKILLSREFPDFKLYVLY